MKQYEYVSLRVGAGIFGTKIEEHRKIIDEYAAKGYRYAGYIPTLINGDGKIYEIDLIFECDND